MGIVVGVALGSGIFETPSGVAAALGTPGAMIAVWVLGGILSLFGALALAEVVTLFPRSGGLYNGLREALGDRVAFVFGWTYMLFVKPMAGAGIAAIFAKYLSVLVAPLGITIHATAAVCTTLILLTWLNVRGIRLGASVGVVLTAIKVASLAAIIAVAAILGGALGANISPPQGTPTPPTPTLLAIVAAMSMVLWTYDGWADVGSVAGEVREPQRTLPRALLLGTLVLMALYVSINLALLNALPIGDIAASNAVASTAMERLVGPVGALVVAGMVVVSTLGSTHASIITGARVTFAQARDGLLFRPLARVHPRFGTPNVSLWVQCTLSCLAMIFFQHFEALAGGFVFAMWIFYALGVVSLFVLRIRRRDLHRPAPCWGYPVVPALFLLAALSMTALTIAQAFQAPSIEGRLPPWTNVVAALVILSVGFPAFSVWRRVRH